jgi:hypothetical protein
MSLEQVGKNTTAETPAESVLVETPAESLDEFVDGPGVIYTPYSHTAVFVEHTLDAAYAALLPRVQMVPVTAGGDLDGLALTVGHVSEFLIAFVDLTDSQIAEYYRRGFQRVHVKRNVEKKEEDGLVVEEHSSKTSAGATVYWTDLADLPYTQSAGAYMLLEYLECLHGRPSKFTGVDAEAARMLMTGIDPSGRYNCAEAFEEIIGTIRGPARIDGYIQAGITMTRERARLASAELDYSMVVDDCVVVCVVPSLVHALRELVPLHPRTRSCKWLVCLSSRGDHVSGEPISIAGREKMSKGTAAELSKKLITNILVD